MNIRVSAIFLFAARAQARLSRSLSASTETASATTTEILSANEFWAEGHFSPSLLPEVNHDEGTYKLGTEVMTTDGPLQLTFKLKVSTESDVQAVTSLFLDWTDHKVVDIAWNQDQLHHESGVDAWQPVEDLLGTLKDLAVSPICGDQKAAAPITLSHTEGSDTIDYAGSVTIGSAHITHERRLDAPDKQQEACEMGSFIIIDWCSHTDCGYVTSAEPKLEGTCTLGAFGAGLSATGTVFGGPIAGQLGVTMTTMQTCWNEWEGTCKFQSAFWGDYCTCHPTKRPVLDCGDKPSPCQGARGGSCSTPVYTCQEVKTTTSSSTHSSSSSSTTSMSTSSSTQSSTTDTTTPEISSTSATPPPDHTMPSLK